MEKPISLTGIINTLLGVVLASPILGFFSVMWQKASHVDEVERQLNTQKAVTQELVTQIATLKAEHEFFQGSGPEIHSLPASEWLEAEEEIQQKIDKSVYRAKN